VLPFLFTTYGRSTIADLHRRMVIHRDRRNESPTRPPEVIRPG